MNKILNWNLVARFMDDIRQHINKPYKTIDFADINPVRYENEEYYTLFLIMILSIVLVISVTGLLFGKNSDADSAANGQRKC